MRLSGSSSLSFSDLSKSLAFLESLTMFIVVSLTPQSLTTSMLLGITP